MNTQNQPNPSKLAAFGNASQKGTTYNISCHHPSHPAHKWLRKGQDNLLLLY